MSLSHSNRLRFCDLIGHLMCSVDDSRRDDLQRLERTYRHAVMTKIITLEDVLASIKAIVGEQPVRDAVISLCPRERQAHRPPSPRKEPVKAVRTP